MATFSVSACWLQVCLQGRTNWNPTSNPRGNTLPFEESNHVAFSVALPGDCPHLGVFRLWRGRQFVVRRCSTTVLYFLDFGGAILSRQFPPGLAAPRFGLTAAASTHIQRGGAAPIE